MRRVRRSLPATATAVAVIALAACSSMPDPAGSTPAAGVASAPGSTSQSAVPTAWPLPADASAAAVRAGLPMLGEEMLEIHYHAHLDVIVRGIRVSVPAGIGIDENRHRISPLHTHETDGIVHIESGQDIPFTLGQLFTEWGQPISAAQVGPIATQPGEQIRVYRNGTAITGDPAMLKFQSHDEIVVWLGPSDEHPDMPSRFDFPSGL